MSRMHECSQAINSTVDVLLRQMPNHQYTSLYVHIYEIKSNSFIQMAKCFFLRAISSNSFDFIIHGENVVTEKQRKRCAKYIFFGKSLTLFNFLAYKKQLYGMKCRLHSLQSQGEKCRIPSYL